jgi:hypothetical protein
VGATASLSFVPALNLGTFDALILMAVPVRGLRAARAARAPTENVPKPIRLTCSPSANALDIALRVAFNAFEACAFVIPASAAMHSMSSALFTAFSPVSYVR